MAKKLQRIPVIEFNTPAGTRFLKEMNKARQQRDDAVNTRVSAIIDAVRNEGNKAVLRLTEQLDGVRLTARTMVITSDQISEAAAKAPRDLKKTIRETAKRIEAYHVNQRSKGFSIKTAEGKLDQIVRPLRRVGLYVPGGHTVYPSTVLMNAIPARVAGVPQIVAVTPPRDGLDPGIAYALKFCRVMEAYRLGGAQAVAALACGTSTIEQVDKIVGPGNAYVSTAKKLLYGTIDIDSIAGPSEVVIMADASARPDWVALDLLAQAEHGSGDEFAICVTEDERYAQKVAEAVHYELLQSPAKSVLDKLPKHAIVVIITKSRKETLAVVNHIAPEHLQIMTKTARQDLRGIINAAAVFIGNHTPVALGDYFIGTNHVLPTGGAARYASPLGVDSFVKRISVAEVSASGCSRSAPYVSLFARSEAFVHHAMSVERRCAK
jgi:histidinol dehydrogenase